MQIRDASVAFLFASLYLRIALTKNVEVGFAELLKALQTNGNYRRKIMT
ncbi:hypothetical protein AB4254_18470 [Vibrio breoganii]